MANHVVPYLTRRAGTFIFRMAVPGDLVHRIGRREFKYSLQTSVPSVARHRCRTLAVEILQLIARVRAMPALTSQMIADIARRCFVKSMQRVDDLVTFYLPNDQIDLDFEVKLSREEVGGLQQAISKRPFDTLILHEAEQALASADISKKDAGIESFDQLCVFMLRAKIEALKMYAARLEGRYDVLPQDPLFSDIHKAAAAPTGPRLDELIGRYCEFKSAHEWVAKTQTDNRRVLKLFLELVGKDRTIDSIASDDVRNYRDALTRLPANFSKKKGADQISLVALLKGAKGKNTIGKATARKYFDNLRAFLNWCEAEEYLNRVPGQKVKGFTVTRAEAENARQPFTDKQLQALFNSPLYSGCVSISRRSKPGKNIFRDGKFWIPLIALYSGLRLGEIVQLLVSDLKCEGGIDYFDVNREEGETKQIKTASSVRRVPVHQMLKTIGFDDLVKRSSANNPKGRLFEDIQPGKDGYFSHNFSKWFGRYVRQVGLKTSKTAFHSFRHNFKDALERGGVSEAYAQTLMGHAGHSVHGLYGGKETIEILNTALQKISYPLDLSPLTSKITSENSNAHSVHHQGGLL